MASVEGQYALLPYSSLRCSTGLCSFGFEGMLAWITSVMYNTCGIQQNDR